MSHDERGRCVIRVAKHMRLPLALHRAQGTFGWAWHWRPPSPRRHRLSTGPGQVGASKYIMYRPNCQVRHAFLTSSRFVLRPRTAIGLSREPQPSSPAPEDPGYGHGASGYPPGRCHRGDAQLPTRRSSFPPARAGASQRLPASPMMRPRARDRRPLGPVQAMAIPATGRVASRPQALGLPARGPVGQSCGVAAG